MGRPTLLLVHGWGSSSRTWTAHLPLLAQRHRVVNVDVRGHGRSWAPESGYDPSTIAGELGAILAEPVVAIGHSWGGQLVTTLAVEQPERVAALVVVDPAYGDQRERVVLEEKLAQWRSADCLAEALRFAEGAFVPETPDAVRALVREDLRATSPHVLAEAYLGMYLAEDAYGMSPASEAYLSRVTRPMLSLFSSEKPAAWARAVPAPAGSEVVAWDGAGHYLHQERPAAFVGLVEEWLGRLQDRGLLG